MTRFLRRRDYKVIAAGVYCLRLSRPDPSIRASVFEFMSLASINYTIDDVDEVVKQYTDTYKEEYDLSR